MYFPICYILLTFMKSPGPKFQHVWYVKEENLKNRAVLTRQSFCKAFLIKLFFILTFEMQINISICELKTPWGSRTMRN